MQSHLIAEQREHASRGFGVSPIVLVNIDEHWLRFKSLPKTHVRPAASRGNLIRPGKEGCSFMGAIASDARYGHLPLMLVTKRGRESVARMAAIRNAAHPRVIVKHGNAKSGLAWLDGDCWREYLGALKRFKRAKDAELGTYATFVLMHDSPSTHNTSEQQEEDLLNNGIHLFPLTAKSSTACQPLDVVGPFASLRAVCRSHSTANTECVLELAPYWADVHETLLEYCNLMSFWQCGFCLQEMFPRQQLQSELKNLLLGNGCGDAVPPQLPCPPA